MCAQRRIGDEKSAPPGSGVFSLPKTSYGGAKRGVTMTQSMHEEKRSAVPLNENHRRGLGATLAFLDETLCRIEEWADGREVKSVFYVEKNTLSPSQRRAVRGEIERARRILLELKNDLELPPREQEANREIWGLCSVLWKDVIELQSRYMRRYGAMDHEAAAYLDPRVKVLAEILQQISRVVRGAGDEDAERS